MSNNNVLPPGSREWDQLESTRKTLGGFLVRFTADRDLLITAVQDLEGQLQALAVRLDASQSVNRVSTPSPAIDALTNSVAQLQQAHEQAVAEARATGEVALASGDKALRCVEQLAATVQSQSEKADSTLARFAVDHDALQSAVRVCAEAIQSLSVRVEANRTGTDQATARAEEALRQCQQLAQMPHLRGEQIKQLESLNRTVGRLVAERQQLETERDRVKRALSAPQELLSDLAARVHVVETEVSALRGQARDGARSQVIVRQGAAATGITPPRNFGLRSAAAIAALTVALIGAAFIIQRIDLSPRYAGDAAPVSDRGPHARSAATTVSEGATTTHASGSVAAPPTSADSEAASAVPSNGLVPVSAAALHISEVYTAGAADDKAAQLAAQPAPESPRGGEPISSPPTRVAALEPEGATACVVQPGQNRACVYRRAGREIVADDCYPITAAHISAWPQWLVAADRTAERMRLVDETGRQRVEIVPEGGSLGPEMAQLPSAAFAALSSKVLPWRTTWLVDDEGASVNPDRPVVGLPGALEQWRQVWEQRRFEDYAGFYGASFAPQPDRDVERWRDRKRSLFQHSGDISVQLADVSVFILDRGATAITTFDQSYRSNLLSASRVRKLLRWQQEGGRWVIAAEVVPQETLHKSPRGLRVGF